MSSNPGRDSGSGDSERGDPNDGNSGFAEFSSEDFVPEEIALDGFPTVDGNFRSAKFKEDDFPTLNEAEIREVVNSSADKGDGSDVDVWLEAWLDDEDESPKKEPTQTVDETETVAKTATQEPPRSATSPIVKEVKPKGTSAGGPSTTGSSASGPRKAAGTGRNQVGRGNAGGSKDDSVKITNKKIAEAVGKSVANDPSLVPPTIEMPVIRADQPPVHSNDAQNAGSSRAARVARQSQSGPSTDADARQARRAKLKHEQQQNQHAARLNDRHRPLTSPVMTGNLSLSTRKSAQSNARFWISAAAICLVVALTGGLVYAAATRDQSETVEPAVSGAGTATQTADETVELPVGGTAPQGIRDLATSTVRILGLNDGQQAECAGSGIFVESDGTILTNAHVVTSGANCSFSSLGVAVTTDPSEPAELLYEAEVVAVNNELDLAVIRITGSIDGEPVPDEFPAVRLGNSQSVALGDTISILGYPVIGGDTITFTTGAVSGFSSQVGIGNRAFIKTDATISAGNSGGMAVDANGLVVGIPTKARGSESGPAVDCRPVDDTNDDGVVDDTDSCVSVGGFLNGLRPINLAKPILSEVELGRSLALPVLEEDSATATFDMSGVTFEAPRFSLGEKGNVPRRAVETLSSDAEELCLFVNWSGVPDGTKWDGLWYIDGELAREHSSFDQEWSFGESGENFWMCVLSENEVDESVDGIRPGLYEVGFFLEGQLVFAEGIEVTPEPVETFDVGWSNDTGQDLCGLAVNPRSKSQQVGLNELDPGAIIMPGEGIVLPLPEGQVVVEAYTCDGEVIAGEYGGIEIQRSETFVIGL